MSNKPPRITIKELINYILDLINFEKGVPYAMKALFLNPKKALDTYFYENRYSLVNPLRFMVLGASLLLVLMLADKESMMNVPFDNVEAQIKEDFKLIKEGKAESDSLKKPSSPFELGYNLGSKSVKKKQQEAATDSLTPTSTLDSIGTVQPSEFTDEIKQEKDSEKVNQIITILTESMSDLLKKYINLVSFLSLPIVGWFSWIMYRGKGYNYAEHLVLLCFLSAWTTWFMIPFAAVEVVVKKPLYISMVLSMLLIPLAFYYYYKKVFKEKVGETILKTLVLYIVQQTAVSLLFVIGFAILFGIKFMSSGI